ncbi:MAG TPA: hypothetical protein VN909_08450 [Candidatus Dormibacteraeota bacterium]|nr:hypothetical protein [Candidatus Dormibacteraeota bacterium]
MSDISLHFTWWQLALGLLAVGFWPLTAAAALPAFWVWRQRASRLAQVVAFVAIGLWAASGAASLLAIVARLNEGAQYSASLRARQRALPRTTVVAGMLLPSGTVLTRSSDEGSDEIVAIDLPAAVVIHGVRVGDARCSAREGARFESGRLVECRLSAPSRIRGIPCSGDVDLQVGSCASYRAIIRATASYGAPKRK